MTIDERAKAIRRAKRALKAVSSHAGTTQQQLGVARDRLNDCYRLPDADEVWAAVGDIEAIASAVYGAPQQDEPSPPAVGRWVSPRGRPRPARPRRPRPAPRA